MVPVLSLLMAALTTINAWTLDSQSYRELVELEIATFQTNDQWLEAEYVRCFSPETNNPEQGFIYWGARHWYLQDKHGDLVLLRPNINQRRYLRQRANTNVIVKDRKRGMSTIIDALYYWRSRQRQGQKLYVLADVSENKDKLYQNVLFAHERMRPWLTGPLRRSNKQEILFRDNGSHFRFLTAGGRGGRSGDADGVHFSEIDHYTDQGAALASFGEMVRFGAWVDKESSPNCMGRFRDDYRDAKNHDTPAQAFFFPWYDDPENQEPLDALETITPTHEEAGLVEAKDLSPEQIKWRRIKRRLLKGDFLHEHPEDDEQCFLSVDNPKFDNTVLGELLLIVEENVEPVHTAIGDDSGRFVCWVPPEPGHRYVLGADVAEGLVGCAYSAIGVLDCTNDLPEQVAEWQGHISPGDFAHVLARIGLWYNTALVAVERNNHGHATLRALQVEARYPKIYKHREYNQKSGTVKKLGWPTTAVTRPRMFSDMRECLDHGYMMIRSAEFIRECMNFQPGDEERDDADDKIHKYVDRVFAWAIAYEVRRVGEIVVV